jgi:hypothetical protein
MTDILGRVQQAARFAFCMRDFARGCDLLGSAICCHSCTVVMWAGRRFQPTQHRPAAFPHCCTQAGATPLVHWALEAPVQGYVGLGWADRPGRMVPMDAGRDGAEFKTTHTSGAVAQLYSACPPICWRAYLGTALLRQLCHSGHEQLVWNCTCPLQSDLPFQSVPVVQWSGVLAGMGNRT